MEQTTQADNHRGVMCFDELFCGSSMIILAFWAGCFSKARWNMNPWNSLFSEIYTCVCISICTELLGSVWYICICIAFWPVMDSLALSGQSIAGQQDRPNCAQYMYVHECVPKKKVDLRSFTNFANSKEFQTRTAVCAPEPNRPRGLFDTNCKEPFPSCTNITSCGAKKKG